MGSSLSTPVKPKKPSPEESRGLPPTRAQNPPITNSLEATVPMESPPYGYTYSSSDDADDVHECGGWRSHYRSLEYLYQRKNADLTSASPNPSSVKDLTDNIEPRSVGPGRASDNDVVDNTSEPISPEALCPSQRCPPVNDHEASSNGLFKVTNYFKHSLSLP